MAVVERVSARGLKALFDVLPSGAGPLQGGVLKALILQATSTVEAQWNALNELDELTTPAEYAHASYARLSLGGIAISVTGAVMSLDFNDLTWAALVQGGNTPKFIVVYIQKSGAPADPSLDGRVPLLLLNGELTPDGSNWNYVVPTGGILLVDTTP